MIAAPLDPPGSRAAPPPVFRPAEAHGLLEMTRVRGATVVTRARAHSPLKLLVPRVQGPSAWAFTSTYGGGLVAGDDIRLDVNLGPAATCLLGTQASTKVYRSADHRPARQALNVNIGAGATCVCAPHPVSCFARARYVQRQRFDLAPDASLVLVDGLTSGRHANGERWAFDRYDSRTDIFVNGRHVFRDALRLTSDDGPIAGYHRTGGFDCFAFAVICGRRLQDHARGALDCVAAWPLAGAEMNPLLVSASPFDGGVVIRAAGAKTEVVTQWLRDRLAFVRDLVGEDPWARLH